MKIAVILAALLVGACLAAQLAQAANPAFVIVWSPVTTNTDNSALKGPVSYQVYGGLSGNEVKLGPTVTAFPYSWTPTPYPGPGQTVCVQVSAIVAAVESPRSVEACATMPKQAPVTPNAPSHVTLTISIKP